MSIYKYLLLVLLLAYSNLYAQEPQNWTQKEVMQPSELAAAIRANKNIPTIIHIGPRASIPGSINVGMVNSAKGLAKLKTELSKLKKDQKLVVYCGCCPYEHCPNVRPAIKMLKEMKFTNFFLLDLPQNIRKNWIDKGYPVAGN